jgi:cysteine-rich repeat protein
VRARLLLHLLLVVLGVAPRAWATTANDLCPPAANPCIVSQGTSIAVSDGSVLNFGTRALVLASGSGTRLDAGTGSMAILAGSVTLNPGSALLAHSGMITLVVGGNVSVLRAGMARARIDVSDFVAPGTIAIDASGGIEVQGILTAQGTGIDGGNGSIDLTAGGDVVVSGEVNLAGGGNAIGGDLGIHSAGFSGGSLLVTGVVVVNGGFDGGMIDISMGGSITTMLLAASRFEAKAEGVEGDGGTIDLIAGNGDIVLNIPMSVAGTTGIDFGGSGGDVTIEAVNGSVVLNGAIELSGALPDGDGGDLDVSAGLDLTQNGSVTALGRDQTGVGGIVDLFAQRTLTVGPINVSGTCLTCSGGDVDASAWCAVVVPAGVLVQANGPGGGVLLRSGEDLDVHGRVEAGQINNVMYRNAANPPNLSGALFVPAPNVQLVTALIPCGGPAVDTCGNGTTQAGETCDDGNKTSCDGCSSTCQIEICGDARLGCDQAGQIEACDDGNTLACDGCTADCMRRDKICGDGTLECGEQCDTGAAIDCDAGACSAQCLPEGCGNGRVECTEQCDDAGPSASCSDMCVLLAPPACGDGTQDAGEGCDDGNTTDCDGCSHLCQPEACGNGVVECDDECDDFNATGCDGCSGPCRLEECGNDIVDCSEECDDGDQNGQPGSDCLGCRFAPVCTPETVGACIPCLQPVDCDPLGRCGGTDCVDDVCIPDPIDCTSDDPCEVGSCHVSNGCEFAPVLGFDSVRCRLDDLADVLGSEGVSETARTKLGKLLTTAGGKVDAAETALDAGKAQRVGKSLKAAGGKLVRFGKKVVKLQPKQITDPNVGSALSERSGDALGRIDTLRGDLGS